LGDVEGGEDTFSVTSQSSARVGRLNAAAGALDDVDADLALQRGEVLGDGGRRDP
jgi:hypothetical protein